MYYPSSENKGADQLRGYREADLHLCFRLGKNPVFSRCGSFVCMCTQQRIRLTDQPHNIMVRERGGIVVEHQTPNQEVLGSILQAAPCCVLEQDTLTPIKPRKRWLRPDMTEKLLTWTFSLNTNKQYHGCDSQGHISRDTAHYMVSVLNFQSTYDNIS